MEKYKYLKNIDFFRYLSEKSLMKLAEIVQIQSFGKKENIFLEGQPGRGFFICQTGNVQLYKTTPDGKVIVIKMIKPGEMFAEVVLFESRVYPVSADALTNANLFFISKDDFNSLLEREDFRIEFIKALMLKQRYLAQRIKYLTLHDVRDRLAWFLQDNYGAVSRIKMMVSKKDVAAAIGATPETFSRLLLKLKSDGLLEWNQHTLSIDEKFWQCLKNLD